MRNRFRLSLLKYLSAIKTAVLFLRAAALLLLCALFVRYRSAAAAGILQGMAVCLDTLIPSLFPFILLACLCSGRAAAVLFRPLSPVMRRVFRLPACAASAVLLGVTAGYPTGAKITAALYDTGQLTREQAGRLLLFCTAPGYAFSAVYVGGALLHSTRTGWNLFFACALSPLIIGIATARFAEKPAAAAVPVTKKDGGLVPAVQSGISACVSLCGFVITFSMLLTVLKDAGVLGFLCRQLSRIGLTAAVSGPLLTMLFEITAGVSAGVYWHVPVSLLAFGLGFSGVCIHLQVRSFFNRTGFPLSKTWYIIARLINGLLCAALYRVFAWIFPAEQAVSLSGAPLKTVPAAGSASASFALLLLSLFFIFSCALRLEKTPSKI